MGTEFSSAELAEALGQDRKLIAPLLAHARQRGALKARRDGHIVRWSLGDGTPEPLPDDHEPDDRLHIGPDRPPIVFAARRPASALPSTSRSPDHFRAGAFTDGSLRIEQGDVEITLTRQQATLLAYLITQGIKP